MSIDKLDIRILPDGTIKTASDEVSPANHRQAEEFLRLLALLTGGPVSRERNLKGHGHQHHHGEEHQHA